MSHFLEYLKTEERPSRLVSLYRNALLLRAEATARRDNLERKIVQVLELESEASEEVEALKDRLDEVTATASQPVQEAVAAALKAGVSSDPVVSSGPDNPAEPTEPAEPADYDPPTLNNRVDLELDESQSPTNQFDLIDDTQDTTVKSVNTDKVS